MDGGPPTTQLAITTQTKDTIAISGSNMGSPSTAAPIALDGVSPCLSEYKSEGFLSRRKAVSNRAKAKMGIFNRAKRLKGQSSDNSDDDVPVSSLLKRKLPTSSDGEDDNVPIATLVVAKKLDVPADVSAVHVHPTGEACVGLAVAHDFGPPHGACMGSIVRVDIHRRWPLYHVLYGDRDEKDYDDGEFHYALELHAAVQTGATLPVLHNAEQGTFEINHIKCYVPIFMLLFFQYVSVASGSDTDDETGSMHDKGGDSDCSIEKKPVSKARTAQPPSLKHAKIGTKVIRAKPIKIAKNCGGKSTFTVDSVMLAFTDKTEFGLSFRAMNAEQQKSEVDTLNKGAATGLKGAIKKNRIQVQFKTLVSEKMRDYLVANRTDGCNMFRAITHTRVTQKLQLKFLSIGEWVEVDADRTPGWDSEGGIAVVINVNDGLADVE